MAIVLAIAAYLFAGMIVVRYTGHRFELDEFDPAWAWIWLFMFPIWPVAVTWYTACFCADKLVSLNRK